MTISHISMPTMTSNQCMVILKNTVALNWPGSMTPKDILPRKLPSSFPQAATSTHLRQDWEDCHVHTQQQSHRGQIHEFE